METHTGNPSGGDSGHAANASGNPIVSRRSSRTSRERLANRPGSTSRSRWSYRSRLLMGLVGVLLVVDFFTALLLGAQVYTLSRENGDLRVNLAKSEEELSRVTPELKRLRADLDELVRGKLPRLRKLEYDRVMALETGYLKNITFTEIVNIGNHEFEYKLVIQNNTGGTLWPEIQILLFNEIGIQVGIAEIGTLSSLALKVDSLGIDEVRSYSGSISLIDKKIKPAYFMVRIPEQARNKPETLELESRERK